MKRSLLAIVMLTSLAACSRQQEVPPHAVAPAAQPIQVAAQPAAAAPVIINQAPAAAPSSGVGDMLMGGAVGYMLGSAGNRNSNNHAAPAPAPATRVINRTTVINKTVVIKQQPKVNLSKSSSYRSSFSSSRSGSRR